MSCPGSDMISTIQMLYSLSIKTFTGINPSQLIASSATFAEDPTLHSYPCMFLEPLFADEQLTDVDHIALYIRYCE